MEKDKFSIRLDKKMRPRNAPRSYNLFLGYLSNGTRMRWSRGHAYRLAKAYEAENPGIKAKVELTY